MEIVIDVGFILAASTFFTKVFGLKGYWSLLPAGLAALAVMEYPVFLAAFPQTVPWLTPIVTVFSMVVTVAGLYDFSKEMAIKSSGKK